MRTVPLMALSDGKPGVETGEDTAVVLALAFVRVTAWYYCLHEFIPFYVHGLTFILCLILNATSH